MKVQTYSLRHKILVTVKYNKKNLFIFTFYMYLGSGRPLNAIPFITMTVVIPGRLLKNLFILTSRRQGLNNGGLGGAENGGE